MVTLLINNNIEFLENIKHRFRRRISCDNCRSEITAQPKSSNLDWIIDSTFKNIIMLFVLLFKNDGNSPTRDSQGVYVLGEIKDFNVLIDNKPIFDQPLKNKQESNEQTLLKSEGTIIIWQETY